MNSLNYIYKIPNIPPSNNKFQGNGSLGRNYEYQNIKKEWAQLINIYCRPKPPYPIARAKVTLHYYFKDRRRRDPDNYSGKFILDGLVKAGILVDDSFQIIDLELKADIDADKKGYVEIEVSL